MSNARGKHVSPGIYTKEVDLSYAVKSLGITTLGVVGETLKGPAFQPILIEDWVEFKDYFGGTNASKFKESGYPKYELPYIAKSYLTESKQLQVCRVLGLSGYNAGPAWIVSAYDSTGKDQTYKDQGLVVAIIRSRGHYEKLAKTGEDDPCGGIVYKYDQLVYDADDVKIAPYTNVSMMINCDTSTPSKTPAGFEINSNNYGQFTLVAYKEGKEIGRYPVSLNSGVKDYILSVLGGKQDEGDAPIYVEELYDYALVDLINSGSVNKIYYSGDTVPSAESPVSLTKFKNTPIVPVGEPVLSFPSTNEEGLKRSNVGQRYLADAYAAGIGENGTVNEENAIRYHAWDYKNNTILKDSDGNVSDYPMRLGHIYTVRAYLDTNGKRHYYYTEYSKLSENNEVVPDTDYIEMVTTGSSSGITGQVLVLDYDRFFMLNNDIITEYKKYSTTGQTTGWTLSNKTEYEESGNKETVDYFPKVGKDGYVYKYEHSSDIQPVVCDLNDYKEQFRCASTPWFVSELKGDGVNIDIKKLFRFHTISDGNDANSQIKISIANVSPDDGTFDVLIRDYYDSDGNMTILERYNDCNMVPGTSNYIGLKIGTTNGDYATKSKYVTVEVIENDMTATCVPCGFLGYPMRSFNGLQANGEGQTGLVAPHITYNTYYDEDIREKRQYFGMSDITGVDIDVLTYKGKDAYNEITYGGYTPGFHLDSTLNKANTDLYESGKLTVDGEYGYEWETVSPNSVTSQNIAPIIGTEADMAGTIYESIGTRKFTAYPYGGFDGWDVYRGYRSNTDDFKANKYKGDINSTGQGTNFSKIQDGTGLNLSGNCINTDYYAYLAGIKQFDNPEKVDINVFATPGIDYVNNQLLVEEVIDMIEEERADSIYVVTTPDKPFGASDSVEEMYTPDDASDNLDDSDIESSYAATYYPWVKYFDSENNIYINLPVTKDVVRNFALTDNKKFPWFASAGIERGNVDCYKAHMFTKLDDEDTLYSNRINPVKSFSSDGIKIWGNKTLYKNDTPLNRINVRRLMLYLRKLISVAALKLIFEPNDTTLKSQFESIVNPILNNIKSNRGLTDCKLVVSQTPEQMDQHELSCKIWVKPTPSLEYIDITFMVTPQGVEFEDQ